MRIDMKCPEDCPYTPRTEETSPFPAFKADNNQEYLDATRKYIDLWVNKEMSTFADKSPLQMAEDNKAELLDILSSYQYPGNFPVEYLMQKLGLEHEHISPNDPEDTVKQYLNNVIALEFGELRKFTMNDLAFAELDARYLKIVKSIPYYKKLKRYSFIHTGLSEDAAQCIVFLELNRKDEFCFVLREHEANWYIRQCIVGNPAMYYKQNELFQHIANLLANADADTAFSEISEAQRSFPDNADLYYYRALCRLLSKDTKSAKEDLLSAIALDNYFGAPYMHLGIQYLNEKNYSEAEFWFAALCKLEPENADAANNMAIALLAQDKKDMALKIWKDIIREKPDYEMAKKNLELYG